jgi:gamma-glutamyltranspeptidase/glutathione hydrolase
VELRRLLQQRGPARPRLRPLALLASVALLAAPSTGAAAPYQHHPNASATGTGGAAATVDSVATQAAIDALRAGGNAVDAAVTAAAVLGVTEPFSCGIGGGGFMVVRTPGGRTTTIDSREVAPAAMQPDSFWENGAPLPFNDARWSGRSAGVPGTVAGWDRALHKYGTFSLAQALAPAIDVAREGFVVDSTFSAQTDPNVDFFDDVPSTAALYLDSDGTSRDPGEVVRNPDLARAYELIAKKGTKGFYDGAIADAMAAAAQHPPIASTANHPWRAGFMTVRDLHDYVAPEREPTRVDYRGRDVFGMGPPSSGGSTVGEALNMLKGFDLAALGRVPALHLFIEASRRAFADRNTYLADPGFFDVPLRGLLSDGFADERRATIDPDHATNAAVAPGDPYPYDGKGKDKGKGGQASVTSTRAGTTTHITTADAAGTVVAYTFTIESTGGSGIVVPGWGFLLNNELTDFNFDSTTHPNRVQGGKRPRSSISPTIVTEAGTPRLALGSPGGSTIITTVLQLLVDRLDLGMSLPGAIADPRATQRNGPTTLGEAAFLASPEVQELGSTYGHAFGPTAEIGAATGVELLGAGRFLAAAEPVRRGGGSAMVVTPDS